MRKYALFLFVLLVSFSSNSQNIWSLDDCIDYALANNLSVKQQALQKSSTETGTLEAKGNFMPSVNGYASHSYNFGQRVDPFTNEFANSRVQSNNLNLSVDWTIFNGFRNLNTLKKSQLDLSASEMDLLNTQYEIVFSVATSYLQILFDMEQLKTAMALRDVTQQQVEQTRKRVAGGIAPKGDLLSIEAQLATEELGVIRAENNLKLSYLALKQTLMLSAETDLEIEAPENYDAERLILPGSSEQVVQEAYSFYPSIRAQQDRLLSAQKSVSIAKSFYIPSLSFSGSLGTGYSGSQTIPVGEGVPVEYPVGYVGSTGDIVYSQTLDYTYETKPWGDQFKDNFNQNLGFSLYIPIFNKFTNSINVQRAKINTELAQNSLDLEEQRIRQSIEKAYLDAVAAMKSYEATKKSVSALQTSFDYAQERFDVGIITAFDFNQNKNGLNQAESDLIRAKYDYIFRLTILDFYRGNVPQLQNLVNE